MPDPQQHLLIERLRQLARPLSPQPTALEPRLLPLHGYRGVLFDVYGTLLVSGSGDVGTAAAVDSAEAAVAALAATGLQLPGIEPLEFGARAVALLHARIDAVHRQKTTAAVPKPEIDIGQVWSEVLRELARANCCCQPQHQQQVLQFAIEYEARVNPVWPMPGAAELLQWLQTHVGVLGIVSNAQFFTPLLFPALFNRSLEQFGFDPQLCIWSYEQLAAKPSPCLFNVVLQRLAKLYKLRPEQVLYIGNDMLNDIWTANAAGCGTVLFAGDQRSLRQRRDDKRCTELNADAIITELSQLPALLQT